MPTLRGKRERSSLMIETFKRQIEELNTAIARCQEQLPASGVPITRQVSCAFNDEAYPEAFQTNCCVFAEI